MYLSIDLNSDLAEGFEFDAAMMTLISSCNIACGGHAGNSSSIQKAILLAQDNKVKIGAHPSYHDPTNFGRKSIQISPQELYTDLAFQLDNFKEIAVRHKANINHWKPHGALYNDLFFDKEKAEIIIELMYDFDFKGELYVAPNSEIQKLALAEGFRVTTEAFADRNYQNNLQLVSRNFSEAVLTDASIIARRLVKMILTKQVISVSGEAINFDFQTVCLHSDTPNAIAIAKEIHQVLKENQIRIE